MPNLSLPLSREEHRLAGAFAAELEQPDDQPDTLLDADVDEAELWDQAVTLVGIARRMGWAPANADRLAARPSTS